MPLTSKDSLLAGFWPPAQVAPLSFAQRIASTFLNRLPLRVKDAVYSSLFTLCRKIYDRPGFLPSSVYRLPFGLCLKVRCNTVTRNESSALQYLAARQCVSAPAWVDAHTSADTSYLLMTWTEGECAADVYPSLTDGDRRRLVEDLTLQLRPLREHTKNSPRAISTISGDPFDDPRIPWLSNEPQNIHCYSDFARQVWIGLDRPSNRNTLKPLVQPLIERTDVPIVFSHGDLYPKNMIFPGGLEHWRRGQSRVCLVDWEYAGWMPLYWDALKATLLECDRDSDWMQVVCQLFPECIAELEIDWQWRSRSRVPLI